MLLQQKPFIAVLVVFGVEGLELPLAPELLVDAGIEVVDEPALN